MAEKEGGEVVRRLEDEEGLLGKEFDMGEEKGPEKSGFDRVTAETTEKACIARVRCAGPSMGQVVLVFASPHLLLSFLIPTNRRFTPN